MIYKGTSNPIIKIIIIPDKDGNFLVFIYPTCMKNKFIITY